MRSSLMTAIVALAIGAAPIALQNPPPTGSTQPQGQQGQGGRQGGGRGRGVAIQPGEECPPGMVETRANSCQAPEFPPPSIVDYRPHSTLVTSEHLVPKAKYPAIDIHGHGAGMLQTPEGLANLVKQLDQIGVGIFISADTMQGERLTRALEVVRSSPYKDRVRILGGVSLQNVGPGWAEKAVAQLDADVKAGIVGIGEISKSFGLTIRKADGSRLRVDDPDLDPVWAACASYSPARAAT